MYLTDHIKAHHNKLKKKKGLNVDCGNNPLEKDFAYSQSEGTFSQQGITNAYIIGAPNNEGETLSAKNFERITWADGTVAIWNSVNNQLDVTIAGEG